MVSIEFCTWTHKASIVTAISFNNPSVMFDVSAAGAVYEGVMSDQKITGKWVQSGTALFLVLSKHEEASDPEK